MSRKFEFDKNRLNMLAGLVEEDDLDETKHALVEEYKKEMDEDVKEVSSTLEEYSSYTGFRPEDSEGEEDLDTENPEENRPPEEAGLPGWSYYDADPTFAKISTMHDDLQHKKILQWTAPLESELEEMDEADISKALKSKIGDMIQEHNILHGTLLGPGFAAPVEEIRGMKAQPDLPGELGVDPEVRPEEAAWSDADPFDVEQPFEEDLVDPEPLGFEIEDEFEEDYELENWDEPWN